jgi:hypothetical protein
MEMSLTSIGPYPRLDPIRFHADLHVVLNLGVEGGVLVRQQLAELDPPTTTQIMGRGVFSQYWEPPDCAVPSSRIVREE